MPQLTTIADIFGKIGSKNLRVTNNNCLLVRNRNAGCTRCMDLCPGDAITFTDGQLCVDYAACKECGTCSGACPTQVFETANPSRYDVVNAACQALFALDEHTPESSQNATPDTAADAATDAADAAISDAARPKDCVIMACSQSYNKARALLDAERVVVVPCLGMLDEALLIELSYKGAHNIYLVKDDCASCFSAKGQALAEHFDKTVSQTKLVLNAWDQATKISLKAKYPSCARRRQAAEYDEEKRSFFTELRSESKEVATIAIKESAAETLRGTGEGDAADATPTINQTMHVDEKGEITRRLPHKRAALLGVLTAWGEPHANATLNTSLWARVGIDAQICEGCRMCAVFCPTGALERIDLKDGTPALKHTPALCLNCGTCQQICPRNALELSSSVRCEDIAHTKAFAYKMKAPEFTYNRPDSMYRKMRTVLTATDQIYDTQH